MRTLMHWFGHRPIRVVSAVVVAMTTATGLIMGTATSSATSATFTFDQGSFNPSLTGTTFQVRGLECDRNANVQATGTMTFVNKTTGVTIGTASMSPSTQFANCGEATITDSENLAPGTYRIQATYTPGGSTPVPKSTAARYNETIDA